MSEAKARLKKTREGWLIIDEWTGVSYLIKIDSKKGKYGEVSLIDQFVYN